MTLCVTLSDNWTSTFRELTINLNSVPNDGARDWIGRQRAKMNVTMTAVDGQMLDVPGQDTCDSVPIL